MEMKSDRLDTQGARSLIKTHWDYFKAGHLVPKEYSSDVGKA